ncbi:unnamed protein product [Darwinula stevensoni]|uniref:Chitin-binding type-2 domain-containing protein n=1 Tax=Darwinula stevensoni TaxID=69355 RepID=A0A7R8WZL2_9CRUS|nr:unnamed protein product [Darwinula stevensoni]CAG0880147.1 unnamed protein product [Darwinula stevensoni]
MRDQFVGNGCLAWFASSVVETGEVRREEKEIHGCPRSQEGSMEGCMIGEPPQRPTRRRRTRNAPSFTDDKINWPHGAIMVTAGLPFQCPSSGVFPFEADCIHFYGCDSQRRVGLFRCPKKHYFDEKLQDCVHQHQRSSCDKDPDKLALVYLEFTPYQVMNAVRMEPRNLLTA